VLLLLLPAVPLLPLLVSEAPEDEWPLIDPQAASDTAQAAIAIHLYMTFSLKIKDAARASRLRPRSVLLASRNRLLP
jgi:hypothetical protein